MTHQTYLDAQEIEAEILTREQLEQETQNAQAQEEDDGHTRTVS